MDCPHILNLFVMFKKTKINNFKTEDKMFV